jgi:hypothetical protein
MQRPLSECQTEFAAALRDPALPPPQGVFGRGGKVDVRRFAVYRNNVFVSLVEALRARFPVTARLVGDNFFRAMARVYVDGEKPRSAILAEYGDTFPAFVAAFEPALAVPYLPDVAGLEVAVSQAYHAADADPLGVEALSPFDAEALSASRLDLLPSARLVWASYPAASIWAVHQVPGAVELPQDGQPERTLVYRPDIDVRLLPLNAAEFFFVEALGSGASIEAAGTAALAVDPAFDLGRSLVSLVEAGAVCGIHPDQTGTAGT